MQRAAPCLDSPIFAIDLVTDKTRSACIMLGNLVNGEISFDPEGLVVVFDRVHVDSYIRRLVDLGETIAWI
jgi:hypothetical protein